MAESGAAGPPPVRDRRAMKPAARIALLLLAAALLGLLVLRWLLQPEQAGEVLLRQAGDALGLQIDAASVDYRLRGTPELVLRDVTARQPGQQDALLAAGRVFISLPWSTIRARGADLTARRIELDAPVLDVPALQRWLATRPKAEETRIPVLSDGLKVTEGRIKNDSWSVDGLELELPSLHPERPLRAHVRGRYLDPPIRIPANLAITVAHPRRALAGAPTGIAAAGTLALAGADWRVPMQVILSGPLRLGRDSVVVRPVKLGIAARYLSSGSQLAFRLGLHGPMAFNNATWRFVPVSVVLDGDGAIPDARARGSLSIGRQLRLHLDGRIARWPQAWPTLPAPLAGDTRPMDFALDYRGRIAFQDLASLELRRDATRFDARFHLPAVREWTSRMDSGSPLPPLDGRLTTPLLQIAGAQLEGVEIEIDDPAVPAVGGDR